MSFIILTSLFFVALLVFAIWSKRTYARRRGDWTESKARDRRQSVTAARVPPPRKLLLRPRQVVWSNNK